MTNYFELYGIPESFHPDLQAVKKKFYELSRQFHPDHFTQGGTEAMQEALQMSAINNAAYKTLKDPYTTMQYILKLHELLEDEEKYKLPPDFLMEMMELNEALDEENWQLAMDSLGLQLKQWEDEVKDLTIKFDPVQPDKELLLKIKDHYFRRKYLLRIQERINKFAPH